MKRLVALSVCLVLAGCTYGGHYTRSGPCEGWHTDSAGCERAMVNRAALERVKLGQTSDEVRAIMGAPEGREAEGSSESWRYLTDYDTERSTVIVLENGIVTAIQQVQ